MDITTKLADFIFSLRRKKLPLEVYEKAKLHPGRSTEAEGINRGINRYLFSLTSLLRRHTFDLKVTSNFIMNLENYFKIGKVYVWEETFAIIKSKKLYPNAFANIIDKNEKKLITF